MYIVMSVSKNWVLLIRGSKSIRILAILQTVPRNGQPHIRSVGYGFGVAEVAPQPRLFRKEVLEA